jgi:hypothetical protein
MRKLWRIKPSYGALAQKGGIGFENFQECAYYTQAGKPVADGNR